MSTDWNNPNSHITPHFTVREACSLREWQGAIHIPNPKEQENILKMALVMEDIRDILSKPIVIKSWIRPILNQPGHGCSGRDYNLAIGGSPYSGHKSGIAVDFIVPGLTCDEVRGVLLSHLDSLRIRVEDLPGSNWVHVDLKEPGKSGRFFKP